VSTAALPLSTSTTTTRGAIASTGSPESLCVAFDGLVHAAPDKQKYAKATTAGTALQSLIRRGYGVETTR
jgi:hypothetical protein